MEQEKPYFLTDSEWYYYDEEESMYFLTGKAPDKAKQSYKQFYDEQDEMYEL